MTINLSFTSAFAGAKNVYMQQHVITSAPAGRSLTVDGAPCTAPCTFQWTPGTNHTIATTTPQAGATGTRYVFSNWSDGGAISHTITASSSPATYTANFTTQYYLTTAASPSAGGTISPASSWRNSGSVVSVSATANSGYVFSGFSGALSGTTTPQNLTMNAPKSVTANFAVSNQPPQAVSVTPSSGSGLGPQQFQFLYSDPNGYADLASLYGRFNASASDVSACSFRYDRASNYIYLYNDAGTAWLGPVILGNQLTNSQCTLGAGSTTPSGNNLTLNLTITFTTAFAGAKNVYMQAVDAASASSGWQTRGAWTVPPPLTITTASPLPSGAWGVAYSPLTLAATGGTPPYSWSKEDPPINGNLLPSGLSLSAGGVLSGTPTRGGQTYGFWIRVTDSLGATATKTFTLAIGPAVQPVYGPSRLEVGLSYMPFDEYDFAHPASSKVPYSCPPGSSIRSCFQTVLAELRAQGVSGVRIFFGLCGTDSTPLVNCGQNWTQVCYKGNLDPPDLTWINRVKDFFGDVRNAGIQNITLTPVHVGGTPYSKPKSQVSSPMGDSTTLCADAPETIYFYPGAPLV